MFLCFYSKIYVFTTMAKTTLMISIIRESLDFSHTSDIVVQYFAKLSFFLSLVNQPANLRDMALTTTRKG